MEDIFAIIKFCEKFKQNGENGDKKILIFFDEIFTIMSRSSRMAKEIGAFLAQMRKRGIIFITTAQEWRLIPIEFRLYVRYQISCNMFSAPFTNTALLFNSINDGESVHWDEQLQDFTCERISANFSKGNLRVIEAYDTYETIGS